MFEHEFINYYRCPFDGTERADVWSCCCNDMCPRCGKKDIEPSRVLKSIMRTFAIDSVRNRATATVLA